MHQLADKFLKIISQMDNLVNHTSGRCGPPGVRSEVRIPGNPKDHIVPGGGTVADGDADIGVSPTPDPERRRAYSSSSQKFVKSKPSVYIPPSCFIPVYRILRQFESGDCSRQTLNRIIRETIWGENMAMKFIEQQAIPVAMSSLISVVLMKTER